MRKQTIDNLGVHSTGREDKRTDKTIRPTPGGPIRLTSGAGARETHRQDPGPREVAVAAAGIAVAVGSGRRKGREGKGTGGGSWHVGALSPCSPFHDRRTRCLVSGPAGVVEGWCWCWCWCWCVRSAARQRGDGRRRCLVRAQLLPHCLPFGPRLCARRGILPCSFLA